LSSDLNAMRQTMLFSGLEVLSYNRNRKNPDLKIYEFGKTYYMDGIQYNENPHLAVFLCGKSHETSWNNAGKLVDFYDLKALVELLLKRMGVHSHITSPVQSGIFSEGLQVHLNNNLLVEYGPLNPLLCKQFDISETVYHADFNWDTLLKSLPGNNVKYVEVPKYPEVRRDLALLLDRSCSYSELEALAFKTERNLLKKVQLFDVYEGDKIAHGKKSYAMSFILQDEAKTLNDKQIEKTMERLIESFEKNLNASVRK
jgi:phenylalanyl-tRNA synthetase beta chain